MLNIYKNKLRKVELKARQSGDIVKIQSIIINQSSVKELLDFMEFPEKLEDLGTEEVELIADITMDKNEYIKLKKVIEERMGCSAQFFVRVGIEVLYAYNMNLSFYIKKINKYEEIGDFYNITNAKIIIDRYSNIDFTEVK